jgi:hypothetical protein
MPAHMIDSHTLLKNATKLRVIVATVDGGEVLDNFVVFTPDDNQKTAVELSRALRDVVEHGFDVFTPNA